jgi:putative ABC transport system ATP-binding protein
VSRIHVLDIEFRYPGPRGFQLAISELQTEAGECAAIVCPSGSGKTTLLNLLAGTLLPQRGELFVGDTCVNRLADKERRRFRIGQIGQVFQAFELLEYLTVEENVLLPRVIDPAAPVDKPAKQRAAELLSTVGLADKAGQRPSRLSHGERQRVAVCRALLNRPSLLLADEPTGNLDQENKQHVVDLLVEQAHSHGSGLLMVTHDRSLLGSFARVIDFSELVSGPMGEGGI